MGTILRMKGLRSRSGICSKLALAGVLGPIIFWAVSLSYSISQPGYSPVRQTLSALVLTPHGWIQTLDFCLLGLLVMLFAFGLYTGVQKRAGLKTSMVLLFLAGFGMLIVGIFPTDPGGGTLTLHGKVHVQTVRIIGILFPLCCFLMIPSLASDPRWRGMDIYTGITGATILILIIGWIVGSSIGWLHAWSGLYERIFTANAIAWLEVTALRLLFLPPYPEGVKKGRDSTPEKHIPSDFWKHLGESFGLVYVSLKDRSTVSPGKTSLARTSEYLILGTLLTAALTWSWRKRKALTGIPQTAQTSLVNTVLLWGMKGLVKQPGVNPAPGLALKPAKDEQFDQVNT